MIHRNSGFRFDNENAFIILAKKKEMLLLMGMPNGPELMIALFVILLPLIGSFTVGYFVGKNSGRKAERKFMNGQ